MACELPVAQVEDNPLQVPAKVGAPRIHDRRSADGINPLALVDVAEETKDGLAVLDETADGRRAHVVHEDLSSDRLWLQLRIELRREIERGAYRRRVDVEDRASRIADLTRGPIQHRPQVALLEISGAVPWSHVRISAAEDFERARGDDVPLRHDQVRWPLPPEEIQHVVRIVVPDVHDDGNLARCESLVDQLQPGSHALAAETERQFLHPPRPPFQFVPSLGRAGDRLWPLVAVRARAPG